MIVEPVNTIKKMFATLLLSTKVDNKSVKAITSYENARLISDSSVPSGREYNDVYLNTTLTSNDGFCNFCN